MMTSALTYTYLVLVFKIVRVCDTSILYKISLFTTYDNRFFIKEKYININTRIFLLIPKRRRL